MVVNCLGMGALRHRLRLAAALPVPKLPHHPLQRLLA
eukprot:SAG25_NODE_5734_length_625_cov_0.872624_3_plen_36_part_01